MRRNDPCPCKSGQRYKNCHGALGDTSKSALLGSPQPNIYLKPGKNTFISVTSPVGTPQSGKAEKEDVESLTMQGVGLAQQGHLQDAVRHFEHALEIDPLAEGPNLNLGIAFLQLNRLDDSLACFDKALAANPKCFPAFDLRGCVLAQSGRIPEALKSFDHALALEPDQAGALLNRGNALNHLGRLDEALKSFDKALRIDSFNVAAFVGKSDVLNKLERHAEALSNADLALAINPDLIEALNNRGNALHRLKRMDAALDSYDRALKVNPDYAEALNNRGSVLSDLKRPDAALACYERALQIKPNFVDALFNRGNVLRDLRRMELALASFERAIELKPDHAEALNNLGNALVEVHTLNAAVHSYDRALRINPVYVDALNNRGYALRDLKRPEDALESYGRALMLDPDYEFLYGTWLNAKMQTCDWSEIDGQLARLAENIKDNKKASPPFPVLALSGSACLQRKAAEIWVQSRYPASVGLPKPPKHPRHDKIRIGYFSADFHSHPVSLLTAELFETHDRSRFELTAFSFGPDTKDEVRTRLEAAFDYFIDVQNRSDNEVALLAMQREIDIAVDLGGFTAGNRTGIFALRAAPIQLSYLGYLGTMGADFIDYLIADDTIIPPAHRMNYAEKIIYLPSYQVNDTKRQIADKKFTREELGLPPDGFVFCCFNNNYKIMPAIFNVWMRILTNVKGSVLFLFAENEVAKTNLRKEASSRGVDCDRLIFGKRLSLPDYLARYRAADLYLDTLPYNAGTTASDALWAGLPVLTCKGETFAGRVAASLLEAIHLPELIASTPQAYEALAVELATNPVRLERIRQKLSDNRLLTPLFDIRQFTTHIEAAFSQIYERNLAGLAPENVSISSDPP